MGLGTGASVSIRRKTLAAERAKDWELDHRLNNMAGKLDRLLHAS